MKLHTLRLRSGQDLRQELLAFAKQHNIQAGFIITCVGALKFASLRMAGAKPDRQVIKELHEDYEIVSLTGTLTADDCHLHIALTGGDGNVVGGHLKQGSLVGVTAEVVIGEDENAIYNRVVDEATGFEELEVSPRQP